MRTASSPSWRAWLLDSRPARLFLARATGTWSYRLLWLGAILLIVAMPLILVWRGEVWLGPATFDTANRPTHSLIVVGGDVTLRAGLDSPLVVFVGNVDVDAPLRDDLVVVDGNVLLDQHAMVEGSLVTVVGQVYRSPSAVIRGTIGANVREWSDRTPTGQALKQVDLLRQVRLGLATGFGLLLLCLVVAALLPWSILITAATARRHPIRSALAGATGGIIVPLLLLPLTLSLVGLPLAAILSVGAVLVWLVGLTAVGFLVGRWLLNERSAHVGFMRVLIVGLTPILLVLAVPVAGPLFVATVGFLGAGARVVSFVERERALDALDAIAPAHR
jgi:hypothetical protein